MKRMGVPAIMVVLLASLSPGTGPRTASGQDTWKAADGSRAPETSARRSEKGFGGWVLVTSDRDWRKKWETPSGSVPRFNEIAVVPRGQHISVLTFYSNPQLSNGRVDVTCDIDMTRPNGTSVHLPDAECYQGPIKEDPRHVFMSKQVIDFVGEPTDPAGRWVVRVTLHDNVRHVTLPLMTSWVLR